MEAISIAEAPAPLSQPAGQEASRDPVDTDTVPKGQEGAERDESDLESVFDERDDDLDNLGSDGEADITRNYNRQRPLHSNQQKPAANTFASVDDQIAALSKHAGKIRLDDVKEGQDREKDKANRATSEQVLDQRTRMILYQMINRGVLSEIHGAISTGKEANVYGAVAYPDLHGPPVQHAVKVYKTAILSFKDRERYITGEHRFKSGADKGNNRKMVKLWAEKEFRNLRRIHSAAIPCPEPIQLKLHVLVMSFLGDRKGYAYPRLRDAAIVGDEADHQWRQLYIQLLGIMRRMYQVCRLVHADLSEYNILYNNKKLYIIDVSQSVEHDHPRSLEFLRMDIKNTGDFFRRQGVDTLTDRIIFDFITRSQGPVEEPGLLEAIEQLYASRTSSADDETAAAELEVENEVFRNQYIPQTLEQVYDIEKDAQAIGEGEGDKLVYRNLLADQVVSKTAAEERSSGDDESDEGAALDSNDGSDDESKFSKGAPRGKRFEDKEDKRQRKHAVKEAKAEKRKEKMPKHLKKRLIATTSRRK
ncbi:Serine/threonine-protein kinase Rio1 [Hypoxylon sp. FL1284]|nr:Serine/threonine-protein kinase Rio1 [Hypoxylon sp. FL1284]